MSFTYMKRLDRLLAYSSGKNYLSIVIIIRLILWTKMKELEKENTTTMVKVVASLPILTKEGSLFIQ
jgi:hypothetical protein